MDSRTLKDDLSIPPSGEILPQIFSEQTRLLEKYKGIEKLPPYPLDVDNAQHQIIVKDFLWRVTEELCEGMELYEKRNQPDIGVLFYEELADALHFYVELFLLLGVDWDKLKQLLNINDPGVWYFNVQANVRRRSLGQKAFHNNVMQCIYYMGLAGNCLKNKPWKQTQMLTDKSKLFRLLCVGFAELIGVIAGLNKSLDDLYVIYMKKAAVNAFRQDTNY